MPVDSISTIFNTTMSSDSQAELADEYMFVVKSVKSWRDATDEELGNRIRELSKHVSVNDLLTHICKRMFVHSFVELMVTVKGIDLNKPICGTNTALQLVCSIGGKGSYVLAALIFQFQYYADSNGKSLVDKSLIDKSMALACNRNEIDVSDLRLIKVLLRHGGELTHEHLVKAKEQGSCLEMCIFIEHNIALVSTTAPVPTEKPLDDLIKIHMYLHGVLPLTSLKLLKITNMMVEASTSLDDLIKTHGHLSSVYSYFHEIPQKMLDKITEASISVDDLIKTHKYLSSFLPAMSPALPKIINRMVKASISADDLIKTHEYLSSVLPATSPVLQKVVDKMVKDRS